MIIEFPPVKAVAVSLDSIISSDNSEKKAPVPKKLKEFLDECAEKQIAIVGISDKPQGIASKELELYFSHEIISALEIYSLPRDHPFSHLAEQLHILPAELLVVGNAKAIYTALTDGCPSVPYSFLLPPNSDPE
jgi:hypothetical protein